MVLPGQLRLRAGWLRRFSPTGRVREPKSFFGRAPICSEAPGPGLCALGLSCPPLRFEGPKELGLGKYLPGPKTASIPAVVSDLRNQSDRAELQTARARARLDLGHALGYRRFGRGRPDHRR